MSLVLSSNSGWREIVGILHCHHIPLPSGPVGWRCHYEQNINEWQSTHRPIHVGHSPSCGLWTGHWTHPMSDMNEGHPKSALSWQPHHFGFYERKTLPASRTNLDFGLFFFLETLDFLPETWSQTQSSGKMTKVPWYIPDQPENIVWMCVCVCVCVCVCMCVCVYTCIHLGHSLER